MISQLHKKLIICAYALTIVFAVASLCMFFVEKPYKGEKNCDVDSSAPMILRHVDEKGLIANCTVIDGKEPSALMQLIINLTLVSGAIMIVLSILAFYDRKKHPEDYPENADETVDDEDEDVTS